MSPGKLESVSRAQIPIVKFCVSLLANAFEKGINPFLHFMARSKSNWTKQNRDTMFMNQSIDRVLIISDPTHTYMQTHAYIYMVKEKDILLIQAPYH